MKLPQRCNYSLVFFWCCVVSVFSITTLGLALANSTGNETLKATVVATVSNPCDELGSTPVELKTNLPTYFPATGSQVAANCLAWQEFIYLNWAADPKQPGVPDSSVPASDFGLPNDTSHTVWESYHEASTVFSGTSDWTQARAAVKTLSRLSKLGDADTRLHEIGQAGDNKWITDKRGGLAYYEVRMNQDEYEFITKNVFNGSDLTTYAGQLACVNEKGMDGRGGLVLPAGNANGHKDVDCRGKTTTYGQGEGAIEIKAAWVALPADGSLNYRYKIAKAELAQPDGKTVSATVGLVGLHIIHKMPGANQFVWATFEQIDNNPDDNQGNPKPPVLPPNPNQKPLKSPDGRYTFYNDQCDPSKDIYYKCQPNLLPGDPCPPNEATQPGCFPYSAPTQITRVTPVNSEADSVTGYAWSLLPADSVFNYYRLIDVQWPNAPSPIPPGSSAPLSAGDIRPADATRIAANSTLETYQQTKNSCMDCHKYASIAHVSQETFLNVAGRETRRVNVIQQHAESLSNYASDYSFLFATETRR